MQKYIHSMTGRPANLGRLFNKKSGKAFFLMPSRKTDFMGEPPGFQIQPTHIAHPSRRLGETSATTKYKHVIFTVPIFNNNNNHHRLQLFQEAHTIHNDSGEG